MKGRARPEPPSTDLFSSFRALFCPLVSRRSISRDPGHPGHQSLRHASPPDGLVNPSAVVRPTSLARSQGNIGDAKPGGGVVAR